MITLSSAFEAPLARARLDTLFILSNAISRELTALYSASEPGKHPEWHELLSHFAGQCSRDLPHVSTRTQSLQMWNNFQKSVLVSSANQATKEVLGRIQDEIATPLESRSDPLMEVDKRNQLAHAWVRDLLTTNGVRGRLPREPFPLHIIADLENQMHCAATSPASGIIKLYFQSGPQALWGALATESVLRHEYLSHLAPLSSYLRREATEGWLVLTQYLEAVGKATGPSESTSNYILLRYREELERSLGRTVFGAPVPHGFDVAASRVRTYSPEFFWKFNGDVIGQDHSAQGATRISLVLYEFLHLSDKRLKAVSSSEWISIDALAEELSSSYPNSGAHRPLGLKSSEIAK